MPGYSKEQMRERRLRFKAEGLCVHCGGGKSDQSKSLCDKCSSTRKKIREWAKSKRKCQRCGSTTVSTTTLCNECTKLRKKSDQERYAKRQRTGLCVSCGKKKPAKGFAECRSCKDMGAARSRQYRADLKSRAIAAYGGKCQCCGEEEQFFLVLDHVNNDGAAHRRKVGRQMYLWAEKNGYPDSLQLLCANCNVGKELNNGICPHNALRHRS